MATRRKKRKITATQFFDGQCPGILSAIRSQAAEMGGTYAIKITDAPLQEWTIDFAQATIQKGPVSTPDLSLSMTNATFAELTKAKTELRHLVKVGDVGHEGDVALVENLSLLLAFLR